MSGVKKKKPSRVAKGKGKRRHSALSESNLTVIPAKPRVHSPSIDLNRGLISAAASVIVESVALTKCTIVTFSYAENCVKMFLGG